MRALWLVVGCACSCDGSGMEDSGGNPNTDAPGDYLPIDPADLRIDVTPFTDTVAAQTWSPRAGTAWSNLSIQLAPLVQVTGVIHGYVPTPTSITVPGEEDAIEADVVAFVPGTRNSDGTRSSADTGRYTLQLPAGTGYMLGVVPTNAQLPFVALANQTFTRDTDAPFELTESGAIFGYVVDRVPNIDACAYTVDEEESTCGVRGARVQLVESETGIGGPVYETEADGYFLLKTLSGAVYDLEVSQGDSAPAPIPHVVSAKIWAEPGQNTRVDVQLGERTANTYLQGHVVDDDGNNVEDVVVRATATSLTRANGTLTIETETDRSGRFDEAILPGHWTIELIPPYDASLSLSPKTLDVEVKDGGLDLDDQTLLPRVAVATTVIDPSTGIGVTGAAVSIREIGYDGYTFDAISDATGFVSLEATAVPVEVTVTPPSETGRAVTHFTYGGPNEIPAELPLAVGTIFAGSVSAPSVLDGGALLELRLAGEDEPFAAVQTGEDGTFSFRVDVEPLDSD
jgi:hypothetical protein